MEVAHGPVMTAPVGLKSPCSATGTATTVTTMGGTTAGPTSGGALVPVYVTFAVPTDIATSVQVSRSAPREIVATAGMSLATAPSAGGAGSSNVSMPTAV